MPWLINSRPDGVSFGCKNCTVQGNIALSQGTFTLRSADPEDNEFFNTTREIVHFFEDGFVKFDVLDFSAHIELESAVKRAQEIRKIQIPFPNITLTPWQVCYLSAGTDFVSGADVLNRSLGSPL